MSDFTIMISGHTDLSQELFDKHYIPAINAEIFSSDNKFIIGTATGVDAMAKKYLLEDLKVDPKNITVVYKDNPKSDVCNVVQETFPGYTERDEYMTSHSDLDVVRVYGTLMSYGSGSMCNLIRRCVGNEAANRYRRTIRQYEESEDGDLTLNDLMTICVNAINDESFDEESLDCMWAPASIEYNPAMRIKKKVMQVTQATPSVQTAQAAKI